MACCVVLLQASTEGGNKPQWGSLQKYWHKGAFFQEVADDVRGTAGGEGIFSRDFRGPTGEDRFDKSVLPAVMQVRERRGAGLRASDCFGLGTVLLQKQVGESKGIAIQDKRSRFSECCQLSCR